jgi:hypothetical protein
MADWKENDKKRLTENFYIDQSRPSFNYVNRHDFDTFKNVFDQKQSLMKTFLKAHPEYLEKEEMPFIQSTGICAGKVLDLGKKFVIDSKTIESLIPSIEDGGSLEAEIFQSIYINTDKNISFKLTKDEKIEMIQKSRACENAPTLMKLLNVARVDTASTLLSLIESQIIKYDLEKIRKISNDKERVKICQNDLFSFEDIGPDRATEALSLLVYNTQQNRFPGPENWIVGGDIICRRLCRAMAREVDKIYQEKMAFAKTDEERSNLIKRRTQLNAEIEMALFCFECNEYNDGTSNRKYVLLGDIYSKNENLKYHNLLANEHFGINLIPMNHLIGNSLFLTNDEQFLQNIDILPEGYYYVSLNTENSAHAIAAIKDRDGEWVIVDPNGGIQSREIIRLLQTLITKCEEVKWRNEVILKKSENLLMRAELNMLVSEALLASLEELNGYSPIEIVTYNSEKEKRKREVEDNKLEIEKRKREVEDNKLEIEKNEKELENAKERLIKFKKDYLINSINRYTKPIDKILPNSNQINHHIEFYKIEKLTNAAVDHIQ